MNRTSTKLSLCHCRIHRVIHHSKVYATFCGWSPCAISNFRFLENLCLWYSLRTFANHACPLRTFLSERERGVSSLLRARKDWRCHAKKILEPKCMNCDRCVRLLVFLLGLAVVGNVWVWIFNNNSAVRSLVAGYEYLLIIVQWNHLWCVLGMYV